MHTEQSSFEGSRRQKRGRVVRALSEFEELTLAELGPRVRGDYGGEYGEVWQRELVGDLEDDGLVEVDEAADEPVVRRRS